MENIQPGPDKSGTMTTQKTNEDFNKKQPDPKDPNEIKAEKPPEVEVPDLSIRKEENPDDLRMNNETDEENDEKNPEFIAEEATEDVEDNGNTNERKDSGVVA